MAYANDYGFNLGVRTGVLRDLDRGQRPEKYISLSDPSYKHSKEGLGRFNFDPGSGVCHARGCINVPPPSLQQYSDHYLNQFPNVIPLHMADLSRPPPGFSMSTPSNPLRPNATSVSYQPHLGGSYTPLSDSTLNNNADEYKGIVFI